MKSLVICGSKRFTSEIRKLASSLKDKGVIVYEPYLHKAAGNEWDVLSDDYKRYIALGLTHDHFYKIRLADVAFIYNKDKYIGVSTTMEIAYAVALNKPIYVLEADDPEWARKVLYRDVAPTIDELLKVLR